MTRLLSVLALSMSLSLAMSPRAGAIVVTQPSPAWVQVADVMPAEGVPLDGYISLGLRYQGVCLDAAATLNVDVRLDGAPIAGTVTLDPELSSLARFTPAAAWLPNRDYQVTVAYAPNSACPETADVAIDTTFTTSSGAASESFGLSVEKTEIVECQRSLIRWRASSDADPYLIYALNQSDGTQDRNITPGWAGGTHRLGPGACTTLVATHVLNGATREIQVCGDEPSSSIDTCDEGCAGSTPGPLWPGLVIGVAPIGWRLRRRSPLPGRP